MNPLLSAMAVPEVRFASVRRSFVDPAQRNRVMDLLTQDGGFGVSGGISSGPAIGYNGGIASGPAVGTSGGLTGGAPAVGISGNSTSTDTSGVSGSTAATMAALSGGADAGGAVGLDGGTGGAGIGTGGEMQLASFTPAYRSARPNDANPEVILAIQRAATRVFGPDAEVVGTSGTGEHGTVRHRLSAAQLLNPDAQHGHALDFHIKLPDGSMLSTTSPEGREFVMAAAQEGISGLGAGAHERDYMGGHSFHMDMYPIEHYSGGMGRAWATVGNQLEQDFINSYRPFSR